MFNHFHKITHKSTIHPYPHASIPTHAHRSIRSTEEKKGEETKEKRRTQSSSWQPTWFCPSLETIDPHSIETIFPWSLSPSKHHSELPNPSMTVEAKLRATTSQRRWGCGRQPRRSCDSIGHNGDWSDEVAPCDYGGSGGRGDEGFGSVELMRCVVHVPVSFQYTKPGCHYALIDRWIVLYHAGLEGSPPTCNDWDNFLDDAPSFSVELCVTRMC